LHKAQLTRANLSHSILKNANLTGANLQGANLSNADLSEANFSYANVVDANLTGSNLEWANLSYVDLSNALVESARFGDNKGLSEETKRHLRNQKALLTHDIREILLGLEELSDSDREWLIQMGEHRDLPDGEILIQENVPIPALYIVIQGRLRVALTSGNRQIATLAGGEVVGEMSFVRPLPPSAMVEAVQNSCVWAISRQKLTEKLETDLEFGCRFYKALTVVLSRRLKLTTLTLIEQDKKPQPKLNVPLNQRFPSSPDRISLASLLLNGDDIKVNLENYDRVRS
jgi:CRP/FNR family transcriptional regulator, cyclic AMP receptor protein